MKTLITYKSRTGFTQRYAEWISEELGCEAINFKELKKHSLEGVDTLIYGGRLHAGMIDSIKKVMGLAAENNCKLVVFATGASPASIVADIKTMWENNNIDDTIPHFYMQAGLCYEKMGFGDRTMMKIFSKMLNGKKDKSESDKAMAEAISKSYDMSSKDNIKPLVDCVKAMG